MQKTTFLNSFLLDNQNRMFERDVYERLIWRYRIADESVQKRPFVMNIQELDLEKIIQADSPLEIYSDSFKSMKKEFSSGAELLKAITQDSTLAREIRNSPSFVYS